jgi:hypothetical protein
VTTRIRTARTASCLRASTSSRPDCNRLRALFRYDHDPLFGRIICRNGRAVQRGFQREACGIHLGEGIQRTNEGSPARWRLGVVFGLGICMDVPFLPFGTLHDAKPNYGPRSPPRWGRFFCLANLFSSEYPWIQPRLFQFARRLRKAASGRAWSVAGEIDSLAALHCQRGYAVLSLIVRMSAPADLIDWAVFFAS